MTTKVFISYSHDSDAHAARVRTLADSLRMFGIACIIDQYEQDWLQGDASLRMQRWIEDSDFVLVVCTQTYKSRFEKGEAPGKGKGAKFEGLLIRNSIYDNDSANHKFVPVLFEAKDAQHRPLPLKGANYYLVNDQAGFDRLYAYLTGQNPDPAPPVGALVTLPPAPSRPTFARPGTSTPNRSAGPSTLPALNPTIVARPTITDEIHTALAAHNAAGAIKQAATTAHGGYGKTVAALLYAHAHADFYTGGRFFLSMEHADLAVQLASLAPALKLDVPNDPQQAAAIVKQAIESATNPDGSPAPSLLILDNITDEAHWQALLDSGLLPRGGCRLLMTTRAERLSKATPIKVGPLTKEQAREVYKKFCTGVRDGPDDATADAITDWLSGLAVAVAAVAARMRLVPHDSWASYWNTLRTLRIDDLPDKDGRARAEMGHADQPLPEDRRTARVIDDAYDALAPHEQRAVQYAALLPEDLAPTLWLKALVNADASRAATRQDGTPELLALTIPPDDLDPSPAGVRAVAHLLRLDVLTYADESQHLLSLHRLWRGRIHERAKELKLDEPALWDAIAACAVACQTVIVGTDARGEYRSLNNPAALTEASLRWELAPLHAVCLTFWKQADAAKSQLDKHARVRLAGAAAGIGVWLAPVMLQLGHYANAAGCLRPVAEHEAAVETWLGPSHLSACYCNLAAIQQELCDLLGARASMERAIAIDSKHFAPDDPTFATSYSNLALLKQVLGDLPGARASIERAMSIEQKHLAPDHPNLAISHTNLSVIQQAQGEIAAARTSLQRAIAITEKCFGSEHPNLATMHSNLGTIQQAQGDLLGARASVQRAILIDSKYLSADHATFGIKYYNLAQICVDEGDRTAACANFQKALTILLKHFDDHHPHVKTVRASMQAIGCTPSSGS